MSHDVRLDTRFANVCGVRNTYFEVANGYTYGNMLLHTVVHATQPETVLFRPFVDSSAKHRGMRPKLIALKNFLKTTIKPVTCSVPCQSAQTGKPVSTATSAGMVYLCT